MFLLHFHVILQLKTNGRFKRTLSILDFSNKELAVPGRNVGPDRP